jgi:hypothetical protein
LTRLPNHWVEKDAMARLSPIALGLGLCVLHK